MAEKAKNDLKRVYVAFPKTLWKRVEETESGSFTSRNAQLLELIRKGLDANE